MSSSAPSAASATCLFVSYQPGASASIAAGQFMFIFTECQSAVQQMRQKLCGYSSWRRVAEERQSGAGSTILLRSRFQVPHCGTHRSNGRHAQGLCLENHDNQEERSWWVGWHAHHSQQQGGQPVGFLSKVCGVGHLPVFVDTLLVEGRGLHVLASAGHPGTGGVAEARHRRALPLSQPVQDLRTSAASGLSTRWDTAASLERYRLLQRCWQASFNLSQPLLQSPLLPSCRFSNTVARAPPHLCQHFGVGQAGHEGGALLRLHRTVGHSAGQANLCGQQRTPAVSPPYWEPSKVIQCKTAQRSPSCAPVHLPGNHYGGGLRSVSPTTTITCVRVPSTL